MLPTALRIARQEAAHEAVDYMSAAVSTHRSENPRMFFCFGTEVEIRIMVMAVVESSKALTFIIRVEVIPMKKQSYIIKHHRQ
jgi:hypothetical protein